MFLFEKIKSFLKSPEIPNIEEIPIDKVQKNLSDEFQIDYMSFFDSKNSGIYYDNIQKASTQATKIDLYRTTAKIDSVAIGLGVIADEITYTEDFKTPFMLNCDLDNQKIEKGIQESFDNICSLMNIDKNLYLLVLNSYIDGQICAYIEYGKKSIDKIYILDPRFLTYNLKDNIYKYIDTQANNSIFNTNILNAGKVREFEPENIVCIDFGLRSDDGIILSELEKIVKTANQLKTLEDLLIPLRFSRSISRRVFNVDVSDLPKDRKSVV